MVENHVINVTPDSVPKTFHFSESSKINVTRFALVMIYLKVNKLTDDSKKEGKGL